MNPMDQAVVGHIRYAQNKRIAYDLLREYEEFTKKFNKDGRFDPTIHRFKVFLWQALFSKTLSDVPVAGRRVYRYSAFDMPEERRGFFFGRKEKNAASLFRDFIDARRPSFFEAPEHKDRQDILAAFGRIAKNIPTSQQRNPKRSTDKATLPTYIATGKDEHGARYGVRDVNAVLLVPQKYKPSFLASTVTSMLLGGVSRIAIMAAVGTTGAPLVAAAVAGGVVAGAVTSYYKNRETIAQEVAMEETFMGRMKARWNGFRKSYSWKQFALNTAASTVGVVGGGALFEAVAENVPMPKLVQDFAAAAKSQVDGALAWTSGKTAMLTAALGENAAPIQAGVTTFFDVARNIVGAEPANDVASLDNVTVPEPHIDVAEESASVIPVRHVQTISIPADGTFDLPSNNSFNRIEQAFADAAPLTPDQQQAAELLKQNFAEQTAVVTGPTSVETVATVPDEAMSYVAREVPVSSVAEQAIEAAVPVPAPTHTVGRGDTLWALTREYYGFSSTDAEGRWDAIAKIVQANPHLAGDPTALRVGETLIMPDLNDPSVPAADCTVVRGQVRGGCTLSIG